ncbi:MAG: cysteine--tRNA ligase [Thermoleophilia bacterium]|nr:cysteine--tRNA ligase [Thermoleophilia bacterium]
MTITPRPKIQVYDSGTRKKQPLLAEGADTALRMYLCGPTVYHHIHIGNARTFAMFSLFVRYLRHRGIDVTFVSNITDINDKIYTAAGEQGVPSSELAATAAKWYIDDTTRLGLGRPDHEPKATDYVPQMIKLITELIEHGVAYESGGDVYYRVTRFPTYGKLSNRQIDDMVAGSRDDLEAAGKKEHALDFALWKAAKADEDTSWESPWGQGRPGWHIECSAMAGDLLGQSFDVHAGGIDLIFPHHENEIAQSCGAGHEFARLWMHGGMLQIGGDKMAKSVGNIATLSEVLDAWPAWVVVMFFLTASYRNPLDYTEGALEEAKVSGQRITESLRRSERYLGSVQTRGAGDPNFSDPTRYWEGIQEALDDDFNTPIALSEVFGLVYDLNTAVNEHATPQIVRDLRAAIIQFLKVFGLSALVPTAVDLTAEVRDLLAARETARSKKDFDESDRIRDVLKELGYVVRDTKDGADVVATDGDEGDAADEVEA